MPPFHLPDEAGHIVSLDQLLTKGPVAVTFHRGHWCPYCRLNTRALAQAQKEIETEGCQIVAIMPDRQQFAEKFKTESQARFTILTELEQGYAFSIPDGHGQRLRVFLESCDLVRDGNAADDFIGRAGYPRLPRQ